MSFQQSHSLVDEIQWSKSYWESAYSIDPFYRYRVPGRDPTDLTVAQIIAVSFQSLKLRMELIFNVATSALLQSKNVGIAWVTGLLGRKWPARCFMRGISKVESQKQ